MNNILKPLLFLVFVGASTAHAAEEVYTIMYQNTDETASQYVQKMNMDCMQSKCKVCGKFSYFQDNPLRDVLVYTRTRCEVRHLEKLSEDKEAKTDKNIRTKFTKK